MTLSRRSFTGLLTALVASLMAPKVVAALASKHGDVRTPNDAQIRWLLVDPQTRGRIFDLHFGSGAAATALKEAKQWDALDIIRADSYHAHHVDRLHRQCLDETMACKDFRPLADLIRGDAAKIIRDPYIRDKWLEHAKSREEDIQFRLVWTLVKKRTAIA